MPPKPRIITRNTQRTSKASQHPQTVARDDDIDIPDVDDTAQRHAVTPSRQEPPSHRYATRPSNEKNPAKKAGLEKKTKDDIQAAAQIKRVAKEVKVKTKEARTELKSRKESEGAKAIAAAMDEHARRSREDDAYGEEPGGGDEEDVEDGHEAASRPKKLTDAEKKKIRTNVVRGAIDSHRLENDGQSPALKKRKSAVADSRDEAGYKKLKRTVQGLDSGWDTAVEASKTTARSSEADDIEGLQDADVATSRDDVVQTEESGSFDVVVVASDDEEYEEENLPKKSRRTKTEVPDGKSASMEHIPDFVKPHFESVILPSLRELYGVLEQPWEMDQGDTKFFDELERLVRDVCRYPSFTLHKSTPLYRCARQKMHDWRSYFQTKADTVIRNEIVRRFAGRARDSATIAAALIRSKKDIKAFITRFQQEWIWAEPMATPPTGALMSDYVLEVFSHHLKSIKGSCYVIEDTPASALALASAALHRSVLAWKSGVHVKMLDFSNLNAGTLTLSYLHGPIRKLETKGRFPRFLDRANAFAAANERGPSAKNRASKAADLDTALFACDPSSPIAPPPSDVED
ncbi:hypothetical protein FA95DRAFT_1575197 [Auriscalpium vulgare]|uniref:Uncharacterized protein n=1 Tax=Auriscalpium vulgare TaxID=40419 RepID=A0ACB8RGS2_9AGAM|nr:hypothetical protein FA95DRAFT_1575197 [Auriscalpium vulgare]